MNTINLRPSRISSREGFEITKTQKRSIEVKGKRTSVSLEQEFWDAFREIAALKRIRLSDLACEISISYGDQPNLSSGIRIFVLSHYRRLAADRT
jgi:predicted DNA-binding ribbon-helix-helix protein